MKYYSISAQKTFDIVSSGKNGLSSAEVKKRQSTSPTNKLEDAKKQKMIVKFFMQFKDLMVIILIVSAVISIAMAIVSKSYGDLIEGGIIVFIVVLNAILGMLQENKAENALESLKKRTEPYCQDVRNGALQKVKAEELVVGDVVVLCAGNIVPADLRLFETHNFNIHESSLSGES